MKEIKQPKYILVEKHYNKDDQCECGRSIKHAYIIKNTETNEHHTLGSGCAREMMGKTITEVVAENSEYQRQLRGAERRENGLALSQSWKEANSEMMDFIINGAPSNDFLADMKRNIEERGTLSPAQFSTVYTMMLPVAELEPKVKDIPTTLVRVKVDFNNYTGGQTITLLCETEEHELVRVFFSSWTNPINDFMLEKNLRNSQGDIRKDIMDLNVHVNVSGSFDGYKIKRARVS